MLQNYLVLETNKPVAIHARDWMIVEKAPVDPLLKRAIPKRALILIVDEVDGSPQNTTLSILSDKLATQLKPYLDDASYTRFTFLITKVGEGFATEFQFRAVPR